MIKFETVSIKYVKEFFTLYNFNCEINSHTLFIGDDYIGSSSILRILSKIDTQYSGNIFIDNQNLKAVKDKNLSVAYIPQKPYLFKLKSVEKNLSFPLRIRKFDKNYIKNSVKNAFFEYNLQNFNKKVKNLNLSEQKILTLIRASLWKPKYILLENFFEDLEYSYFELAINILNNIKQFSTIIATEKENKNLKFFKDFNIIVLDN